MGNATKNCIAGIYLLSVSVLTGCKEEYAAPTLTTLNVNDITYVSAKSGGEITDNGGSPVTMRGVCWSTSPHPEIVNSHTNDGDGSGRYTSNIEGLSSGTTYYVRAYASNSTGTAYGNEISFITTLVLNATLSTAQITGITMESALSGGNITKDGGGPITARGVCWSTTENPTIEGSKTTDETGTGTFVSTLTDLSASTRYYVRAYATNAAGTAYGNQERFTTAVAAPPSLTTKPVSGFTLSTAVSGGNILVKGGAVITANGVCWSTSENPTIDDHFSSDVTGSASFNSTITGLASATVYYVRAYATNRAGTSYGNQITFVTPVSDIEGNLYKTVLIGNQIWMAENLKTTKFNNNTTIPVVTDNAAWVSLSTPAYCWYNNSIASKETYGALYNWFAVASGRLCPAGWHEPADAEFTALELYLGLPSSEIHLYGSRGTDQATQLKSTTTWNAGVSGTNSSGFNALGAGYRQWTGGSFYGTGIYTYFWTSSDDAVNGNPDVGWYRRLDYNDARIYSGTTLKVGGKYVRCIKD